MENYSNVTQNWAICRSILGLVNVIGLSSSSVKIFKNSEITYSAVSKIPKHEQSLKLLEPTTYSHVRKTVPPPGGHVFSTDQNHFQTQEVTYPLHKHFGKVNATSRNSVEFHEDRTRNAVNQISP
ncbi:hypothetical protein DPMN_139354 [Dreissena polymorpha]|uniref:Uncharacterized protein n=1 Tax=Dreissena polymorpha TaxID=45954 RepID=A0A9D4G5K1_DREPO|nr:hypothetical protein DPMN_139354 [Dreissena polymorpha]